MTDHDDPTDVQAAPAFWGMGTLADFERGPAIGQGGMATVYRALDRRSGEFVALKLIQGAYAHDRVFLERFRREAMATTGIHHENVCQVKGFGQGGANELFIAFELIEGGSVRDLKKKMGGRLPVQVAVELTAQLLAALAAAHDAGIIHRDLKPANLMITKAGVLKLVDFGIAKSTGDETLTQTGMLIGTPAFMSPEQVRGEDLDGRSDLFSAGLVLHELVAGKSPYVADNPTTSLVRVLREEVPLLSGEVPALPPLVEGVHARLTMKASADRFVDARAALHALQPYLDDIRRQHPRLIAECLEDPARQKIELTREAAQSEFERGEELLRRHGRGCAAAAIAYLMAVRTDPTHQLAQSRLSSVAQSVGLQLVPVRDPRIDDVERGLVDQPLAPGLLKRAADLHKAVGNLWEAAGYLKRYLRVRDDSVAQQQLATLLWGPDAPQTLVSITLPRLQTVDIVAGIKTGGMKKPRGNDAPTQLAPQPTSQPGQAKLPDRTSTWQGPKDVPVTSSPIALAMSPQQAREASRDVVARPSDFARMPHARMERGPDVADEARSLIARLWLPLVVLALIGGGVWLASRGVSKGVQAAQQEMQQHAEGQVVQQENATFGVQRGALFQAEDALKKGNGAGAVAAATLAMEGKREAGLMLDALWLRAQGNALLHDNGAARQDLEDYLKYANLTDPRREQARAKLLELSR